MHDEAIPVKVFDDLIREVVKWMELNRPHGANVEETTQFVLSAAFSSVAVAGAACASIGALGGEITEDQFVSLAREAFRRAHGRPEAPAGAVA